MEAVEQIKKIRSLLLGSAVLLIALGVVMIYSASAIYAFDQMKDSLYFLKRHLLYLALGGIFCYAMVRVNLVRLRRYAPWILGIVLVMLVLVLIPHIGSESGGARRWFKLMGFSFQPSEFLKLGLILFMADFLDRRRDRMHDWPRTLLPALAILGVSCGLVFLQPDLGTSIAVALVALILFFAAGFKISYLVSLVLISLPALMYAMLSRPYRRKRLMAFLQPWEDPQGVGFQIIQSFLALGSGGWIGVGLGQSQQKLFYLPESHTDFIFSIIGEELGFLGTSSVVLIFAVFIFAGLMIVFKAPNVFLQLLSLGLVALIGLECVINIGVSTGALPTKGLSLPFISYGGTALLVNMAALGLLLNISRRTQAECLALDPED